jgi:hypothetical protein
MPPNRITITLEELARKKAERARLIALNRAARPPITRVFPVPVVLHLGGAPWEVEELTLGDLAEIQAGVTAMAPHPFDLLPTDRPPTAEDWHAVVEAAAVWPPRLGTPEAAELGGSAVGLARWLLVVLRKRQPETTAADALDLLGRITPAEWLRLRSVAFGVPPVDLARQAIEGKPPEWDTVPWTVAVEQISELRNWDYATIRGLTLSQWRLVGTGGKSGPGHKGLRVRRPR